MTEEKDKDSLDDIMTIGEFLQQGVNLIKELFFYILNTPMTPENMEYLNTLLDTLFKEDKDKK